MRGQIQTEHLQEIVRKYQEAGQPWPATTRQIAAWAMRKELLTAPRDTILGYFSEQLARAMREEYYTDPQGRNVRVKHAARVLLHGEQRMLWDDIRTAEPAHMRNAFQLRRQQIVGDCRQLQLDADSYNENGNTGQRIQMEFDFTQDLAELDAMDALARQRRSNALRRPSELLPGAVLA